jgi:DNA invertase Pin-like site-specific DNA recombinase
MKQPFPRDRRCAVALSVANASPLRRALLYLRQSDTSGDGAQSLSLDSQASVLRADAERHGWRIVGEIRDADEKGWDDQRPGLLELYRRCEAGDVDLVAVWSLSRLARSLLIQETCFKELDRLDVSVWSHEEPHADQPLYRQILGAVNEAHTRDQAAHIRRAVHAKLAAGIWHGTVPYGYRQPDPKARLEPDQDVAGIVREMFEKRASGIGPAMIALDLTRRGVPTPRGLPAWHTRTVSNILAHVAHRGAVQTSDGWVEDSHPAIVSKDLWCRAQNRSSRRSPRAKSIHSWLDGLTEHACGQPMYLNQPTPSHDYALLRCRDSGRGWRHAGAEPCSYSPRAVKLDRIEPLAWEAVVVTLNSLARPETILANAEREYHHLAPDLRNARQRGEERQQRLSDDRERWLYAFTSGHTDRDRFDREMDRIAAEQQALADMLSTLPARPDEAVIQATWEALRAIADEVATITDTRRRARLVRRLGVVVVSPSGARQRTGKPGMPADLGRVSVRLRPELVGFFCG